MTNSEIFSYLALFSHELKAPLNNILNLARLMELNIETPNETNFKRYLSMLISSALHMKTFISNTIELGRIQQDKQELYLEEFNIVEILCEIIELTKIMIENKPIEVRFNAPKSKVFIVSDPVKVRQILLNISSNSVKFTKKGFILYAMHKNKKGVLINVKDTGCGIEEEKLKKIFTPYCNLEKTYEALCENSGLGLYITKQLLSLLEGDISIKSEYKRGTEVELFIPSKKQP